MVQNKLKDEIPKSGELIIDNFKVKAALYSGVKQEEKKIFRANFENKGSNHKERI